MCVNSSFYHSDFCLQFFKVPVYDTASKRILSENELLTQLLEIVKNNRDESSAIGVLTAQHRDTLAGAYERLVSDSTNRLSVDCITKALFIVCLDKNVPLPGNDDKLNVASHQFIHGGGSTSNSGNRWFDKTLQLIVNENGLSGLNYEHSPGEGQPIAVLSDFIIKHTYEKVKFLSNLKIILFFSFFAENPVKQ